MNQFCFVPFVPPSFPEPSKITQLTPSQSRLVCQNIAKEFDKRKLASHDRSPISIPLR